MHASIMTRTRNSTSGLCCWLLMAAASVLTPAQAQDKFPVRPLTYVVSFSAGSSPDVSARMTAPRLAARIGQPVLVDNKPGANSTIGTLFVARSKPDGYTFMHGGPTALSTAPALIKNLAYDPLRDFSAITITTEGYYVLLTAPKLKGMSLAKLIEQIAKAPDSYAVGGQSISTEILHHMLGNGRKPKNIYVRYKTESGLVGDLLAGRLPLAFATISAGLAQLGSGKVGAITVSSPTRLSSLPNVPAMSEVMPGAGLANYAGLYLAAKTPKPIINYLYTHLVAVLKEPELAARTAAAGSISLLLPPEESDAYMRRENPRWIRAIQEAGIQPQ